MIVLHFADTMKNMLCDLFQINREELEEFKNNPHKHKLVMGDYETDFRILLQVFGTDVMKKYFGEAIWAGMTAKQVKEIYYYKGFKSPVIVILIPDFRFPTEYEVLYSLNHNLETIRVVNKYVTNKDTHISETALDDFVFDRVIENNYKGEN